MCGFSLNMDISTLVCNVDSLDIFHFLRRSHIDWELEMHIKLSSKFPCILALLWEQSKQNCPELPVQIFDFSIFLKCLRQLDGGWNFIKNILTLCYKAVWAVSVCGHCRNEQYWLCHKLQVLCLESATLRWRCGIFYFFFFCPMLTCT